MKKILAFVLAIMVVLSLCGCGATPNTPKIQTVTDPATTDEISFESYEDSLEGLCAYFTALGYAYDTKGASDDETGDPIIMMADMIGAEKGYKFTYNYNGQPVVLELYYYSDTTNSFYQQAVSEGKITVTDTMEEGTVDVTLSSNGKYLMIYSDESENADREKAITTAFKNFYA